MTSPIGPSSTSSQAATGGSCSQVPLSVQNTVQQLFQSTLPFNYDRNTSSRTYQGPLMRVVDIDQATGTLIAEFSSDADGRAFYHRIARDLAAGGFQAAAKSMFDFCESSDGMHALKSLKEGLAFVQRTSQQEEKPLDERLNALLLADSQLTADKLDAEEQLKKQTRAYQQAVNDMTTAFLAAPPNIDLFFEHFLAAHRLNPASFRHFFIPLSFLNCFPEDIAHELLQKAYEVSPLMTFNTLFALSDFDISLKKNRVFSFLIKAFPNDLLWYSVVLQYQDSFKPTFVQNVQRNSAHVKVTFAKELAKGLNNILTKDFPAAREAFSTASFYHISDKRPYLYIALLDLYLDRDTVSVEKLIETLNSSVDWQKETTVKQAQNYIFSKNTNNKGPEWPAATIPELPLLKSLLKFFKTDADFKNVKESFLEAFDTYVWQREFDPLFADFLIQVLLKRVPEIHSHYDELKKLYIKLMSRLHGDLSVMHVDLTEYEECIKTQNNDLIFISHIILAENQDEKLTLLIDPHSREILRPLAPQLRKKLLWTNYYHYSDLSLRNMEAKPLLIRYEKISGLKTPFHGKFLDHLLTKCDQERDPETQIRLVKWATTYAAYWPLPQRQTLADLLIRWDLSISLLPRNTAHEAFLAEKQRWQDTVASTPPSFPLREAEQGWYAILNQKFKTAELATAPLFHQWGEKLKPGFDPTGLQVLCTTRALLQNDALLGKALPKRALSPDHDRILQAAFSLLARQEVINPLIIPKKELNAEEVKALARLYFGRCLDENEEAYKNRLTPKRLLTILDPREAKPFNPHSGDDEDKTWALSTENRTNLLQLAHWIEEELQRNSLRVQHNNEIAVDIPPYSQDAAFIAWVRGRENLIHEYLEDPLSVFKMFDKHFPSFSRKKDFVEELEEKARHQTTFEDLKGKMEKPRQNPGDRFWQLVHLTAQLVERVLTGTRSEVGYNIVVQNEREGRMVMELLYEAARLQWKGSIKKLEDEFHGPEIHLFGGGPRIPHFNAIILTEGGTFSDTHIYYS